MNFACPEVGAVVGSGRCFSPISPTLAAKCFWNYQRTTHGHKAVTALSFSATTATHARQRFIILQAAITKLCMFPSRKRYNSALSTNNT